MARKYTKVEASVEIIIQRHEAGKTKVRAGQDAKCLQSEARSDVKAAFQKM